MGVWESLLGIFFILGVGLLFVLLIRRLIKNKVEKKKEVEEIKIFEDIRKFRKKLGDTKRFEVKKKIEESKIANFEHMKRKLLSSPHYNIIEGYVRCNQPLTPTDFKPIDFKLIKLLKNRGYKFDVLELSTIIKEERYKQDEERYKQDFDNLKSTIKYNRPTELHQYIYNFIDNYSEKDSYYINIFINVLKEDGIDLDENQLYSEIENLKEKIGLEHYEQKLLDLNTDNYTYSIDEIDFLTGYEFELFLKELFKKMGYSVEQTKMSGDQGADLIVSKFNLKVVVQAKRYSNKVSNKAIQEVVASIKHYEAEKGMVVATNEFTQPAIDLAKSNGIELIDRYKLEQLINKYM